MAARLPRSSEAMAPMVSSGIQMAEEAGKSKMPRTMRMRMMSPPALEPTERKAVMEFGAPS